MIKDTCLQTKHVLVTFRHDMLPTRFRRQDTCLCFSSHHKLDLARQQPHTLDRICLHEHKSSRTSTLPHQICCAERDFSVVERHACGPGGACLSHVEIDTFPLHVQEQWASLMATCHVFCAPMSMFVQDGVTCLLGLLGLSLLSTPGIQILSSEWQRVGAEMSLLSPS